MEQGRRIAVPGIRANLTGISVALGRGDVVWGKALDGDDIENRESHRDDLKSGSASFDGSVGRGRLCGRRPAEADEAIRRTCCLQHKRGRTLRN